MNTTERASSSPARRLHSFIGKARSDKKILQQPAKQYIASEFGVSPDDTLELYRSYSVVLSLLRQTHLALERSKSPMKESCLNAIPRIAAALSKMQIDQQWHSVNQSITAGDYDLLNVASCILETDGYELLLSDEEINGFTADSDEIQKELNESELPNELKVVIDQLFYGIRQALRDYRVSGVDGLKSSLALAYGQIILDSDVYAPHRHEGVLIKVWEWFGRINTAVSTVGHAHNAGKFIGDVIDQIQNSAS